MIRWFLILALIPLQAGAKPTPPLVTIPNCTWMNYGRSDGDSFQVRTPDGKEHIVRLYGIDCIELHTDDPWSPKRLLDQRRYFGIYNAGSSDQESADIARFYANEAAKFTESALRNPFTLHTRYTSGKGDPESKRIYGLITLSNQKDLGVSLVQAGLARPVGLKSSMPGGVSLAEVRTLLADSEIEAIGNRKGIWSKTDWTAIPEQRGAIRREIADARRSKISRKSDYKPRINPNRADQKELESLEGIGPAFAERIIKLQKKKPIQKAEDLLAVDGLTEDRLEVIKDQLIFE